MHWFLLHISLTPCVRDWSPWQAAAWRFLTKLRHTVTGLAPGVKGINVRLQQSRVVGTATHQGQRFSLAGRDAVRSGVEPLRLDCGAQGVASGGRTRQTRGRCSRVGGGGGVGWGRLALRAQQRGRDMEPNLLPSGASTFHPIVFFSSPFNELCQSQSIAQMKLWATSSEKI